MVISCVSKKIVTDFALLFSHQKIHTLKNAHEDTIFFAVFITISAIICILARFFINFHKFVSKISPMSRYIDIHTHNFTNRHIELRAVGIHPWDAEEAVLNESIFEGAQAVGEIGLDYACNIDRTIQEALFRAQLTIAERLNLPVVLHCVRAFAPTLAILKEYCLKGVIFHGFIGSKEQATEAVKRGYFLSFGEGVKHSPKTVVAMQNTPLKNLFLETDESLTPIEEIYAMAAQIRGESIEKIINSIAENYNILFQQ